MIKSKQALSIVLNSIRTKGTEKINAISSLHRILAEDVYVRCDLPPFDNSAMDGYALRSADIKNASRKSPVILEVIDDVPAGYVSKKRLEIGQAIRIMTGAPIPNGADSVVMVEFTQKFKTKAGEPSPCAQGLGELRPCTQGRGEFIKVFNATKYKENIRAKAEDVKKGEKVLAKGSLIRPQEMGMLASLGINRIRVAKKPKVGILATGDELVKINRPLAKGKIRNSNTYCLAGQVLTVGAMPVHLGIARDKPEEVRRKIISAINKNIDLLLVSGGVSVGDYDLVKDVLVELGTRIKVWKVAVRPGKPLVFGYINPALSATQRYLAIRKGGVKGIPVFGLPGNPVSSMVVFEEFARPAILKMCGAKELFRPVTTAIFKQSFKKKKGIKYFVRVKTENKNNKLYASLTGPQGSGILKSMVLADAIMVLSEEISELKRGDRVCVQLLIDRV